MASQSPQPPQPHPKSPPDLPATLRKKLKGARRLAILAVGSSLRGDDAAGLLAAERLGELLKPYAVSRSEGESPSDQSLAGLPTLHELSLPTLHANRFAFDGVEVGIFIGETAPENLTGEIRRFQPSHVVILDAADLGLPLGQAHVIDPSEVADSAPGSTHNLPMHVLTNYLCRELSCRCLIVGIQPSSVAFGQTVNPVVSSAAANLAQALLDSFKA